MKPARTLIPADENRLLLGLVVQPFVAAALAFALFPLVEYTGRLVYGGGRPIDPVDAAPSFAIMAGVVASFVTGFIAYPGILWLLKRGPLTRAQTMIAGVVLGNVPGTVTMLGLAARHLSRGVTPTMENLTYGWGGAVRLVVLGSVVGLVCSAVFWWIAGHQLNREHN